MTNEPNEIGKELAEALVAAQADMPDVYKGGENKFDKYTYARLEDYVKVVKPILKKHGLVLLTSVKYTERLPDRTTKNGGIEHAVQVALDLTIAHKSGQSITTSACGEGQDRGDKAVYKAITGARKYALACAFGLATTDDPEAADGPAEEHTDPMTLPVVAEVLAAFAEAKFPAATAKRLTQASVARLDRVPDESWRDEAVAAIKSGKLDKHRPNPSKSTTITAADVDAAMSGASK